MAGGGDQDAGDLRVGGPDDGANHCWLFAEVVVVGDESDGQWKQRAGAATDRLKRLGWRKSAALLIAVAVNTTGRLSDGVGWDRPSLTAPVQIPLPGGGAVILAAFDVKRDAADTLTAARL